jgi:hypothetical protein
MSAFTYAELVAALQSWPEDNATEYNAIIPRLISLGETRLIVDLNLEIFDLTDTAITVNGNNQTVQKPDGLIVTRSLYIAVSGVRFPLMLRTRDFCLNYWPDDSILGVPRYYYEVNEDTWKIVPTPNQSTIATAIYVARPAGLSVSNTSTWLSTYCGDLLFCCSLMEAEQWIKADDRYGDMKTKYMEELLPSRRAELRNMIRGGDYNPWKPAAQRIGAA